MKGSQFMAKRNKTRAPPGVHMCGPSGSKITVKPDRYSRSLIHLCGVSGIRQPRIRNFTEKLNIIVTVASFFLTRNFGF